MSHRLQFRRDGKAHLARSANALSIAGLAVLAMAMTGAILLITNLVFGTLAAITTTACVVATFLTMRYALPPRRRLRDGAP